MELNELEGGRSMMKSMEMEDHGNGRIKQWLKECMWPMVKIFCMCTKSHDPKLLHMIPHL